MLFNEADVVVSDDEQNIHSWFTEYLRDARQSGRVKQYGKSMIDVPTNHSLEIAYSTDQAVKAAKYIMAGAKLTKYVTENLRKLILDGVASDEKEFLVKSSGLSLSIALGNVPTSVAFINRATVLERFKDCLEPDPNYDSRFILVDPFKPKFDGNLAEAYSLARKNMYTAMSFTRSLYTLGTTIRINDSVGLDTIGNLSTSVGILRNHMPLSLDAVRDARNELLQNKAQVNDSERVQRIAKSRTNFESYWQTLKSDISRRVFPAEVKQSWDSIPLLESGSNTSRTWGIEVETVQAQLVSRPRGWEATTDGSLESMNYDGCSCSCDECDNGYHGDCDSDENCSDCMEYVSPILSHFHSNGLKQLCEPLEDADCNETPGIHVHVGADDLTITDVGRLVRAYSIVSPFIEHISYRETRGYCKDVSSENLAFWLSAVRKSIQGELINYRSGEKITATQIVETSYLQPDDRYRDLNLQALSAHGTIEFRVMGPRYNYEHLIRWAWFCREMVNVSRLDIPVSVWTSVRSMADVISVLRQYGSEIPSDEFDKDTHALANAMNGEFDIVDA